MFGLKFAMALTIIFVSYFWLVYHIHQLWQSFLGLKEAASVCLRYKTTIMLHRPWRPLMSKKVWQSLASHFLTCLQCVPQRRQFTVWQEASAVFIVWCVSCKKGMHDPSAHVYSRECVFCLQNCASLIDEYQLHHLILGSFLINAVRISFWFVSIIHSPYLTWNWNWFSWNISEIGQNQAVVK